MSRFYRQYLWTSLVGVLAFTFQNCTTNNNGDLFSEQSSLSNGLSLASGTSVTLSEGVLNQVGIIATPASSDRTIFISVAGGSAGADPLADFSTLPNSVTLPAGHSQVSVGFQAAGDGLVEGDESFALTLTLEGNSIQAPLIVIDGGAPPPVNCAAATLYCDYSTGGCGLTAPASLTTVVTYSLAAAQHNQIVSVECVDPGQWKFRYYGVFSGTAAFQCLNGSLGNPVLNCDFAAYEEPAE
jgi:hypothetical protein